ncbi:MAG: transcriptional regulator [bacterium]|jgi:predicted ArsR family transcriptional regulator|nr:transcriptional regulator [bacterium]
MEILALLKKHGRMTSRHVGEEMGVTPMGARQHLTAMEKDGLVTSEFVRQKAGRPALYFRLTEAADSYFPQNYAPLALNILKSLEEIDGRSKIKDIFQFRQNKLAEKYTVLMNGDNTRERVIKLVKMRDEDGYMAEMKETDEDFLIIEHNCPINCIAQEYPEVCSQELDLFTKLLNKPVHRESHQICGKHCCVYKIPKK